MENNTACSLIDDPVTTLKSLKDRGALFKSLGTRQPWKRDSITAGMSIGSHISVSQTSMEVKGVTLKQAWLKRWRSSSDQHSIQFLRSLYGLEISACTGNARRISMIKLFMTTPIQHYLRLFPWTNPLCRKAIMEIIEDHDVDGFIYYYTEKPDWRKEIRNFITACLDVLCETGVSSSKKLTAFWMLEDEPLYVEFPAKLYPWAEILKESTRTFTMAVLTNTCLSSKEIPHGNTCTNGMSVFDKQTVLETQFSTRKPQSKRGGIRQRAGTDGAQAPEEGQTLNFVKETGILGHLEIMKVMAVPYAKDREKFYIATWRQISPSSPPHLLFSKRPEIFEELLQGQMRVSILPM